MTLTKKYREVSRSKTHIKDHMEYYEIFDTHWGLCQSEGGEFM